MELNENVRSTEYTTGAIRQETSGRGLPSLLPFDALIELSKLFEAGAHKYAPRNWEKGIPLSRYIDSQFRHTSKIMEGDLSEPHVTQNAWNAVCLLATHLRIRDGKLPPELNDLPNLPLDAGVFPIDS